MNYAISASPSFYVFILLCINAIHTKMMALHINQTSYMHNYTQGHNGIWPKKKKHRKDEIQGVQEQKRGE